MNRRQKIINRMTKLMQRSDTEYLYYQSLSEPVAILKSVYGGSFYKVRKEVKSDTHKLSTEILKDVWILPF